MSQMSTFKGKYNRFLDIDEKEVFTSYQAMITKKPNEAHVYREFFPETGQITYYFHIDNLSKQKNGTYKEWYDDGTLIVDGQYKDGKKVGEWLIDNSIGTYQDGKKEGEWKKLNEKGKISATYNYINDKKEGPFVVYDTLGMVENEGIYRSDTIFSETRQKTDVTEKEEMPIIASCRDGNTVTIKKCSDHALYNYIIKNLRYPAVARENGVTGEVIAQFVIDKDGSIKDIRVLRGLCQSIKEEVIRLIKNMPPWNPGYQNRKPVRVLYTLPVKFRLE